MEDSSNVGGTGIPNVGGTGIPNVGGTGIPNVGGTGIPNVSGTGIPNVGGTGIPNAGGTGIPIVGGTGIPFSLYANNDEMVILWAQCDKPRVLFLKNVVRGEKRKQLPRCSADLEYSCEYSFTDVERDDDHILKSMFVRQNLKRFDTIFILHCWF